MNRGASGSGPMGTPVPSAMMRDPLALDGFSTTEAVRTPTFHLLAFVYFATGLAAFGVLVNAAQVLKETAGLDMAAIARTQALVGASVLLGRVIVGGLLDRVDARLIGLVMSLTTAIAVLGYATSTTATMAMASALLLGLSIGGESDVLPYLAARYFGVRSFGTIAGLLAACSTLGGALAAGGFAGLAAASHSVTLPLFVFAAVLGLSALAFLVMAPPTIRREALTMRMIRIIFASTTVTSLPL